MADSSKNEQLTGVLEKIVYANEENHFTIGYLKLENNHSKSITIAGNLPGIQCGETLDIEGQWKNHPRFGLQFSISGFKSKLPATAYGIRKYLGSGLVKGIGKTYANKIVDFFGNQTLEIISSHSKRLQEIPGIGAQRAKSIKIAWDEQQVYRDVMIFLQTHNVSNSQCIRLVKKYGHNTIQTLQEDPYILVREIEGIGFLTADKIAHNLGIPSNSKKRIQAGIFHILREASGDGHTCYDQNQLLESTNELLELELVEVQNELRSLISSKDLNLLNDEIVQLPNFTRHEHSIATAIIGIEETPSILPSIKSERAVEWFESKSNFKLAPEQKESIIRSLNSKVSIITGGPGTGKTTLLRGIVSILRAKKVKVVLASPTGRAAKRLAEATGGYAQTIHRLLGYDVQKGGFISNESKPLNTEFVIVDESSMLDTFLAASLLKAIPYQAHLLLVGDTDQLPSVGAGNVLADLIDCKQIPVTKLKYIYRQGKGSQISSVAHSILANTVNPGKMVESVSEIKPEDEIVFVKSDSPEDLVNKTTHLISTHLPRILPGEMIRDSQLLAPLHRGTAGTENLNKVIQAAINPTGNELKFGNELYRIGDRVIQTRNNYDKNVFNGDIGKITNIDNQDGLIEIKFDDLIVEYERSEFGEFQLAYSITIHKSQGSEYPIVILPLLKQHFVMLERNLLYTGITRGKKRVYIIGQVDAFAMAVRNQKTKERQTNLVPQLLNRLQIQ